MLKINAAVAKALRCEDLMMCADTLIGTMDALGEGKDHFALLGLPRCFALDRQQLEAHYRKVQEEVHPDRHADLPARQRRLALEWSSRVNEAWRTLRDPIDRARYLIRLNSAQDDVENNTAMPPDFLMQQMAYRETLEWAQVKGDIGQIEGLHRQIHNEMNAQIEALRQAIDEREDYTDAALFVRQALFHRKLLEEIDQALDAAST
jgi:molecular chaperone HscB